MTPPLDVIESSAPKSPSPRRIVTVVAVLGLVAGLVWYVRRPSPAPEPAAEPTPSATPSGLPDRPVGTPLPIADVDLGVVILPSRPPQILNTRLGTSRPFGVPGAADWNYQFDELDNGRYLVVAWPPESAIDTASAWLVDIGLGTADHVVSGEGIIFGSDSTSVPLLGFLWA
jgi:hypothetical protein